MYSICQSGFKTSSFFSSVNHFDMVTRFGCSHYYRNNNQQCDSSYYAPKKSILFYLFHLLLPSLLLFTVLFTK